MGLRLPRIDPTGENIFLPYPEQSTSCSIHDLIHGDGTSPSPFNGPAFEAPPPPPPCIAGAVPGGPVAPVIPVVVDDCMDGPPAILTGGYHQPRDLLHLPEKGKRGRIMLSPRRVIAPVGGEVILLAGVCGNDGYLMMGEPIEWLLSPDSVGNIIQIGEDDRCKLHRLVSKQGSGGKVDGDFARGLTSTKPALITRGTRTCRDDVPLKKGETWLSLSSPSEGVSRVTVLAPESDCWDHRKATTTIYWIDAHWDFPAPQQVAAGRPVRVVTRVTRSEMAIPAEGWIVRYQFESPTLGGFAPDGRSEIEVRVNGQGEAPVDVLPAPNTSGTSAISIQVIRPAEEDLPRMTLAQGATTVSWLAPRLELRAGGPEIAGFDQPITVYANVSNPGDLPAENVILEAQLPPGVTFVNSSLANENVPNRVTWQIRDTSNGLPPRTQLDVDLTVRARGPFRITFTARGANVPPVDAVVQVDVYQPSLAINVVPVNDRVEVGQEAQFDIEVKNTGDRPLAGLRLQADSPRGLVHLQTNKNTVVLDYDQPTLQPGQSWRRSITYRVLEPGEQCVRITANATGAQQATGTGCVIGLNPPTPTPSVIARITAEPDIRVGESKLLNMYVTNNGRVPLTNVNVMATYDALVLPTDAEVGVDRSAMSRFQLTWSLPRLDPGQEKLFRVQLQGVTQGVSNWLLAVQSAERAEATTDFKMRVLPGQPATPRETMPPAPVPTQPTPRIPTTPNEVLPDQTPPASPQPTPVNPGLGTATGLRVEITDRQDPGVVQEEIPYLLTVSNDREVIDDTIRVRIRIPNGYELVRVKQAIGGVSQTPDFSLPGVVDLPTINTLRARESLSYELVFRSSVPQQATIRVEATSRLTRQPVTAVEQTEIRPR